MAVGRRSQFGHAERYGRRGEEEPPRMCGADARVDVVRQRLLSRACRQAGRRGEEDQFVQVFFHR